jgi:predicted RNA-binding Zn-ribbon protein involved in translation (DUF1610 family)
MEELRLTNGRCVGWRANQYGRTVDVESVIFITVCGLRAVIVLEMDAERTIPTQACPSCGQPMRFAREIHADQLLRTYDCKECGAALTEAEDSQAASTIASEGAPIVRTLLNEGLLVSAPDKPKPVQKVK